MFDRMKTGLKVGITAAVLATSIAAVPTVSQAAEQTAMPAGSYQVADSWTHDGGGDWRWRRHGWNNNHDYNRGGYWRGDHYRNNWGGVAAAGAIGLAAGAIIANQGNRGYYGGGSYDQYCSSRYRSFNPNTGTYTGYDGLQHRCVMP